MNAPFLPLPDLATAARVVGPAELDPERAADIAVIADHVGYLRARDDVVMGRVIRRLGWAAFSDEALYRLAREFEREARAGVARDAENRALAAGRRA